MFRLGNTKPEVTDGVIYYAYRRLDAEGVEEVSVRIVDDKSIEGDNLARRRIRLLCYGEKLFNIKYAVYFLGDLIKVATPHTWFIDSSGKLFQYFKQTRASLTFPKLRQVLPLAAGGAVVEVEGIHTRFKTLFMPDDTITHAGILIYGKRLVLYGLYDRPYKNTWRMV